MKKFALLCVGVILVFSMAGCGATVDLNTPKSEQLSKQYDFYGDSMNSIRSTMSITPEQADEVFIILTQCGLDGKITNITGGKDSSYNVWYGSNSFAVEMKDGSVSKVTKNLDELYPDKKPHNYLMDQKLKEVNLKNDAGAVVGKYAYISVSNSALESVTSDHIKEFVEAYVSGGNYNWVSIVGTDKTGIQFAGSSNIYGSYGKMNDEYKVVDAYGSVELQQDGTYKLPNFASK